MFGMGGGKGSNDGTETGRPNSLLRRSPSLRVIDVTPQPAAAPSPGKSQSRLSDAILAQLIAVARQEFANTDMNTTPRGEKARLMGELVSTQLAAHDVRLNALDLRNVVRLLIDEIGRPMAAPDRAGPAEPNDILPRDPGRAETIRRDAPRDEVPPQAFRRVVAEEARSLRGSAREEPTLRTQPSRAEPEGTVTPGHNGARPAATKNRGELLDESGTGQLFYSVHAQAGNDGAVDHKATQIARDRIHPLVMDRIDLANATKLPRQELERQLTDLIGELLVEQRLQLNSAEQRHLVTMLVDDMLGLGPLEPLLADETITDIMVNGPHQVYIERKGKLHITDVNFRDDEHVMNMAKRIVSRVGRRIDESSPLVDARLLDGSRVNVIVPPLAIDGPTISIRKFSKKKLTLERMVEQGNMSVAMGRVLQIAARCRLNILISGGTGSGKTTLLNAMSRMIDHGERIVTIEDAAELQLQQPHVVRLETRPPSIEGAGEIVQRDLVKNALRMRPDRIILGEVRGSEALDMLQAMNTGHDGSMCTVHANRPREALTRLENMVNMSGASLQPRTIRQQVAAAINIIVQIARMRDGVRRVTNIMELVGMEGDVITGQDLFVYEFEKEGPNGELLGAFKPTGLRPHFLPKAAFFGLEKELMEVV
jgi:pilus assembly protein CpaF